MFAEYLSFQYLVKMKKVFLILGICILFLSCEKKIGGPAPDTIINITYLDQNSSNLLNPTHPNHISADDIDVYMLDPKNERRRLFRGNLDMPEMFRVNNELNGSYVLTIFFEPDTDCIDKNNTATMYLTYKNVIEDKFVGQFNRAKFPRTLERLWVNDKLVWDFSFASHRMITIIK